MILHIAGAIGGAERTTNILLQHLTRETFGTTIVAGSPLLRPYLAETYDRFIDLQPLRLHGWFPGPAAMFRDAKSIGRLIDRERPDVILATMHYAAALACLGGLLSHTRPKVLASLRGPAFEHIRRYEAPTIRRAYLRVVIAMITWLSSRTLVPSGGTGEELRRRFLAPLKRIRVIPNGIDHEMVAAGLAQRPEYPLPSQPGVPVVCTVARLSKEKRIDVLVRAFAQVLDRQQAHLLIVGSGPERGKLEALVRDKGLFEHVTFAGHQANVFPYLQQADLFVHTCAYEGFGYALLEAMACGIPVVALDCPYGPREILGDNRYGRLVVPGDTDELALTIQDLLASAEELQRMSDAARVRAQQLSVENMVDQYRKVFLELI